MLLKLRRQQRTGGIVTDKIFFQLDARVELTPQEQADVKKYKLGSKVIYNSEASKKHIQASAMSAATGNALGFAKGLASLAMAHLNLNITINDLLNGKHVECKDMDELLGSEEAVMEACKGLKLYLDTAATFDGREVLVDFSSGDAQLVQAGAPPSAPPAQIAAPPTATPHDLPTPQLAPQLAEQSLSL